MELLTLLQPAGANLTGIPGLAKSIGPANGEGAFEQALLGLTTAGLATSQPVPGTLNAAAAAAKTAASAGGLLAAGAAAAVESSGTALTGAAVLGINTVNQTTQAGVQSLTNTVSQPIALPVAGSANPITNIIAGVKAPIGEAVAAVENGKTVVQALSTPGSVSAVTNIANKAAKTLTSAAQGQITAGSAGQQGAAAPAAGNVVTAALTEKSVKPGETAKQSLPLAGASSEVATAKATITAAVIDAPGAGKKTGKSAAKTDASGAKGVKSGASARQTPQPRNGLTVAQAAQAATKASAANSQATSGKAQAVEPFASALTSAVAAGGEGAPLVSVSVSGIAAGIGTDSVVHTATARAAPPPVPVPQQVAVQFSQALAEGAGRILIQLQPQSLGRVEVEIELSKDGRLSAVFIAERPETLEMLQRDSRALERALNEAGIRTDANGLSFSLRGEGRQSEQFNNSQGGSAGGGESGGIEGEAVVTPRAAILNANALLDIQV